MRLCFALVALVAGIVILPWNAHGQWRADGVPISGAEFDQLHPAIVSDGAGGAILAWQDYRSGVSFDIYAQRVNASGVPQWTANGVALCIAGREQSEPTLVADGMGGAIVAWQDYRDSVSPDIYAQRVSGSGVPLWTANGVALCTAEEPQVFPVVVSDGTAGAIVAWADARGGTSSDIYAQRVDASGRVQWVDNGIAISAAANNQQYPAIVADGAGGAIVTWTDARSGAHPDIYVQRVDASGASQWAADGVAVCTAADKQQYPAIIADGAGGAIVTWTDGRSGTSTGIYSQRVNATGAPQWPVDGVLFCASASDKNYPKVASDGAGGAIAAWNDYRSGNSDIYIQWVSASGAPRWTDGVALCTAPDIQESPAIVADGAGGAIVTWLDARRGPTHIDIYVQRVNTAGAPQWETNGAAVCVAGNKRRYPTIVASGAGGAIIAWQDNRSGAANFDIYARQVAYTGPVITESASAPGADAPVVTSTAPSARDANSPSWRARPLPYTKVFFVTNGGGYVTLTSMNSGEMRLRGVADVGVMVNTSERNAFGGSLLFIVDDGGFTAGPVLRYRRWFERERSLDLAVGTPVIDGEDAGKGSILGLVMYNPVQWFGVAVRPEYLRNPYGGDKVRVSVGAEFGWYPGMALTVAGGLVVLGWLVFVLAVGGN